MRRVLHLVLLVVWVVLAPSSLWANPRVQVRGASRIDMQAFGPSSRFKVTGTVRDEVSNAIPRAKVVLVGLVDAEVPVPWTSIQPCGRPASPTFVEHTDHVVEVDDSGSWCVEGSLGRDHATLRATFAGDGLHNGTRTEIVWDAAQRSMSVSFSPRPDRINLDVSRQRVFAHVVVPPDVPPAGVSLELKDEQGQSLGNARTDDAGLALFDFPTTKLAGPGIGSLTVAYPGSSTLAATSYSLSITRFARVRLEPEQQQLQGDPTSGLVQRVRVSTQRGAVADGSIEALLGSEVVGAGVVAQGAAEVPIAFVPPRGPEEFRLTLRYVAVAPYYQPGEVVQFTVRPVRTALVLRLLPVVLAAGVAAWLLRGWRRPKRLERVDPRPARPTGAASVEIVKPSRGTPRWSGRVLDAHEGEPIAGARLRVIAPSFVELDVVFETHTDEAGCFAFELRSAARDLRLRLEAPLHTEMEKAMPPPSDLVISLVSRRRTLLQRLVEWARRAGKPWDQSPEPTPGHVGRVAAAHHHRDEIVTWAAAVERRAYGPDPVDARAEREVRALEPGRQAAR